MPHWKRPRRRPRHTLPLLAVNLILSACSASTNSTTEIFCPQPIWPTASAVDWIEQAETPPAVDDWLDRITRQQETLAKVCR